MEWKMLPEGRQRGDNLRSTAVPVRVSLAVKTSEPAELFAVGGLVYLSAMPAGKAGVPGLLGRLVGRCLNSSALSSLPNRARVRAVKRAASAVPKGGRSPDLDGSCAGATMIAKRVAGEHDLRTVRS